MMIAILSRTIKSWRHSCSSHTSWATSTSHCMWGPPVTKEITPSTSTCTEGNLYSTM
uniref:Uncharacterized protein n=1 Tax=Triticum urartu TaxID=4572 RepID=A0A8R7QEP7_TRIUA